MVKSQSPGPPFISHYAVIQGERGIYLTFSVFELQRGYLYQNGVEFRQKGIGAGLNLVIFTTSQGYMDLSEDCLLYTSPSPRDGLLSRMPSSA